MTWRSPALAMLVAFAASFGCASIVGIEEVKQPSGDDDDTSSSSSSSSASSSGTTGTSGTSGGTSGFTSSSGCNSTCFSGACSCTTPGGEKRDCPPDKVTCAMRNGIESCSCNPSVCGC